MTAQFCEHKGPHYAVDIHSVKLFIAECGTQKFRFFFMEQSEEKCVFLNGRPVLIKVVRGQNVTYMLRAGYWRLFHGHALRMKPNGHLRPTASFTVVSKSLLFLKHQKLASNNARDQGWSDEATLIRLRGLAYIYYCKYSVYITCCPAAICGQPPSDSTSREGTFSRTLKSVSQCPTSDGSTGSFQ